MSARPRLRVLALLAALLAACGESGRAVARPPNLIVWLVDTLRADHLSCYGYERPTSPHLDGLARNGVLFEQVHAHSNWTQPSVTALLTGCYPPPYSDVFENRVPEGLLLASEWLGQHGYVAVGRTITAATSAEFGFAQGYDDYVELDADLHWRQRKRRESKRFRAENVVDSALEWLDTPDAPGQPFFLMLHTVDPHEPYSRHPDGPLFAGEPPTTLNGSVEQLQQRKAARAPFSPEEQRFLVDLYDEEIVYNDQQLGRLVAGLSERGLLDDTLLVVVSDHGEEFFERGQLGHGHANLHAELTHVPFVLHWPAGLPAGVRVKPLVQQVDLLPTLLDLMGLPPLPDADGRSVARLVREGVPPPGYRPRVPLDRAKSWDDDVGLRTSDWLLLTGPAAPGEEETRALYRLSDDLDARQDVGGEHGAQVARMIDELDSWRVSRQRRLEHLLMTAHGEDPAAAAELRARLQRLGYLGGDDGHVVSPAANREESPGEPAGDAPRPP